MIQFSYLKNIDLIYAKINNKIITYNPDYTIFNNQNRKFVC